MGTNTAVSAWLERLGLSTFVAFDVETTGLDPTVHQIIEVGAVRFESGRPSAEFQSFVHYDRELDPFITGLTGIHSRDLIHAPKFVDIAEELFEFVADSPLVGQNIDFDLGFLRAALDASCDRFNSLDFLTPDRRAMDSAMLARIFWPELSSFSLSSLCETFGVTITGAHRAINDARATGEVLDRMIGRLPDRLWHGLALDLNRLIASTNHRSRFFFEGLPALTSEMAKPAIAPPDENSIRDAHLPPDAGISDLLGVGGLFQQRLDFFEGRATQVAMAEACSKAFDSGQILVAEAPTGVGKSLAYLVPAIRWVEADAESARQVIVSSHTKVLQEQLWRKDVGEIQRVLGGKVRASVLKGRANYLCKRRLRLLVREAADRLTDLDRIQLMPLLRWSELTVSGDISEISGFRPRRAPHIWAQVASDSQACAGSACSAAKGDFYRQAQDRAGRSQVVFVNHALLATDFARFSGPGKRVVLDEAHQIERAMVGALTSEISIPAIRNSLFRLVDERGSRGLLATLIARSSARELQSGTLQSKEILSAARNLYAVLRQSLGQLADFLVGRLTEADRSTKIRFRHGQPLHAEIARFLAPLLLQWTEFSAALQQFLHEQSALTGEDKLPPENLFELRSACDNVQATGEQMRTLLAEDDPGHVTWVEFGRGAHGSWCSLYSAPISVGSIMEREFWPAVEGAVLTSATLAVGGSFSSFREAVGLSDAVAARVCEAVMDSPFRLEEQMLTLVPSYLPDPRRSDSGHTEAVLALIQRIVAEFPRGTLILSTSNDLVERITNTLSPTARASKRLLLSQSSSSSLAEMVSEFRQRRDAILVGAASFWEGIDVVGDALQIVLVTRLPFDVPSEPWVAARCEALQQTGHDSFREYSLAIATLRLKQGLGRLIRHPTDRGVAVITDPRLFSTTYGRTIRQSLPSSVGAARSEAELFTVMQGFLEGGAP
jgi:predicted DnaQ family exonuclease/DinG family helicase